MAKKKNKVRTLEDAIMEKFPKAAISEIRRTKFGLRVLGMVPARDKFDKDHIVEWTETGTAMECAVGERDYREIIWNDEEQKPEYISTKMLLSNENFNVDVS